MATKKMLEFIGPKWKIQNKVNDMVYKLRNRGVTDIEIDTVKHNPTVSQILNGNIDKSISEKDTIKITIRYNLNEEDI